MFHSFTDPPFVIASVVAIICGAWFLIACVLFMIALVNDSDSGFLAGFSAITGFFALIIGAVILIAGLFPFGSQYHTETPVSGMVQATGSRFIGDGSGGTNQRYVITIGNIAYGCDDTRCGLLHKGDAVTLLCEKQFQWSGPEGFVCKWGRFGLNGQR